MHALHLKNINICIIQTSLKTFWSMSPPSLKTFSEMSPTSIHLKYVDIVNMCTTLPTSLHPLPTGTKNIHVTKKVHKFDQIQTRIAREILESWRQYFSIEYWNIPGGGLRAEQLPIKVGPIFPKNIDFLCSFSILGFSRYIYLVIRFKLLSYTRVYCTLYTCTPVWCVYSLCTLHHLKH